MWGNTIDEIIETIFNKCLSVNYIKKDRDCEQVEGYYVTFNNKEAAPNVKMLRQLFMNCKKRGGTIMLGETNATDYENTQAQTLEFIYTALKEIFEGKRNDKLNKEMRIHNIADIHRILNDRMLLNQLCRYIYVEVSNKFKTHIQKANPDFYVEYEGDTKKFKPINYLYLDDTNENNVSNYELTPIDEIIPVTGNLSSYILREYYDSLTNIQKIWVEAVLEYGVAHDGAVYDLDNNLLYTPQQNYQFKRTIKNRLQKKIQDDVHIDTSTGKKVRWIYRR